MDGAIRPAATSLVTPIVSAPSIAPKAWQVVAFVVLVIVLLVRPQGILSEVAEQKEVVA